MNQNLCFSCQLENGKSHPISKSGDVPNVNKIRPITLMPLICKLLENYINDELVEFLEPHDFLYNHQGGFWTRHRSWIMKNDYECSNCDVPIVTAIEQGYRVNIKFGHICERYSPLKYAWPKFDHIMTSYLSLKINLTVSARGSKLLPSEICLTSIWPLQVTLGQSKCRQMKPHMTSYPSPIVTLWLSWILVDLEI